MHRCAWATTVPFLTRRSRSYIYPSARHDKQSVFIYLLHCTRFFVYDIHTKSSHGTCSLRCRFNPLTAPPRWSANLPTVEFWDAPKCPLPSTNTVRIHFTSITLPSEIMTATEKYRFCGWSVYVCYDGQSITNSKILRRPLFRILAVIRPVMNVLNT